MKVLQHVLSVAIVGSVLVSCKKTGDPIIVISPSTGSSMQLNGLIGKESGSGAGNTVFVDLSTDKQTAVARNSWDLGFYSGSDFRVILNNTTWATAKVLAKNDLAQVGAADTVGLNKLNGATFDASAYALIDDPLGDLTKTLIPAVSANDADNKVVIINPGSAGNFNAATGESIPARDWYKIRVLRTAAGGYKIQYAKLAATSFSSVELTKDNDYTFRYFSLDNGMPVLVEPAKDLWDFKWSYAVYQTSNGSTMIPYAFSDLVLLNHYNNVQAAEVKTSTVTYDNYAATNISTTAFSSAIDAIGSKWRSTSPATGVKTDVFYVIKDSKGNVYKVRFLAMGAGDAGTRGKPQFEYKLVK
jgi:hypothetical protein